MLDFSADAQLDLLQWVYRGGATLHLQNDVDLQEIMALTRCFPDRPLDLADASLVLASEQLGLLQIVSIDRDFDIYRSTEKTRLSNESLELTPRYPR